MIDVGFTLGVGLIGSVKYRLTKKETYLAVGSVALGVGLASKNVREGILAGFNAGVGIIAFDVFHIVIEGSKTTTKD